MAKADLEELYAMVAVGDTVELVGQRNEETAQLFGDGPNAGSGSPAGRRQRWHHATPAADRQRRPQLQQAQLDAERSYQRRPRDCCRHDACGLPVRRAAMNLLANAISVLKRRCCRWRRRCCLRS